MRYPIIFAFLIGTCHVIQAQAPDSLAAQTPTSAPITKPLSAERQVRKSVAFIQMVCTNGSDVFESNGTGFWVVYPDERLGKDRGFMYLVTNRHVAECWDDSKHPMTVSSASVRVNLKSGSAATIPLNANGNANWFLPSDESVDLAVLPLGLDPNQVDFIKIPVSLFLRNEEISEGDKIMFSGFFYQFQGLHHMEPIVRQGILAMIPDEDMTTTTGKPGRVFLGDVHIFGGNSGSPVFVDLGGSHAGVFTLPGDYRMLGIVSGMFYEDTDFKLEVTTMVKGKTHGNSGIAMIVPVNYLMNLLDDPQVKAHRDKQFAILKQGPAGKSE